MKQKSPPAPILSWAVLVPLVVLFFCFGVYVGSVFFGDNDTFGDARIGEIASIGLPGTNNVFVKWKVPSLRGNPGTIHKEPIVLVPSAPNLLRSENEEVHSVTVKSVNTKTISANINVPEANRKLSLHATSLAYMTAPAGLDDENALFGAWIYMDDQAVENEMRTIFSNKMPGCDANEGQYGISLYVNAWQTNDHKLYAEYGGRDSGCSKVSSESVELRPKQWYFVAVYAGSSSTVLFIDGKPVGIVEGSKHEVQTRRPFLVGVYDKSGTFPFNGNISQFTVVHNVASNEEATHTVQMLWESQINVASLPGVVAHYSLQDAAKEKPNSIAVNSLGRTPPGQYSFPLTGSSVAGVRIPLLDGLGEGREVTKEMRAESDNEARLHRRESVRNGMKHAWKGYKQHAWGSDEVKPLSNRGQDNWGGMGVTLVDSLDTLWLMGLKDEFREARDWVANSLSFDRAGTVSVFETTIRELGGLLSAYDLSNDKVFLAKARVLADKLMPAFNTESGIPMGMVNFRNGQASGGWSGSNAILSELGSLQLEFRYLAQQVQAQNYEMKSMRAMQVMHQKRPQAGLYPIKVSVRDGSFTDNQVTFGALGDSFYEYLLKVWLQGGRKETWLREMYDRAMDGVMDKLLLASDPTGYAFLSDWNGRYNNRKMDHLVCFMPGALALGAYTDPNGLESERAKRDLAVAKALMYTCYQMYHKMSTGISPEYVEFPSGKDFVPGSQAQFYILRPETAESLFILNKLTGDPIYRDWAWEIWQAIDHTCRTETAYGAIRNVNQHAGGGIDDRMESFFLAETLKYLYLAQDPDTEIDLMKVVFNTEAHPMKVFDDSHVPVSG